MHMLAMIAIIARNSIIIIVIKENMISKNNAKNKTMTQQKIYISKFYNEIMSKTCQTMANTNDNYSSVLY